MLEYLRIVNLALMEQIELEFSEGFTAVTGETGAGKSVLLGALSLLAGNRAEKSVIRQGADRCEVEGVLHFKNSKPIDAALEELGLPPCEDGVLVLRRSLSHTKAPRIQINGALTTLSALQQLGEFWVDFHGPGEPQKLFKEAVQLAMLDAYGRIDLSAYRAEYAQWRDLLHTMEETRAQGKLSEDEIAFYRSQIEKIDALAPSEASILQLERDFTRLTRAQDILSLSAKIEAGLDGENGLCDQLPALLRSAQELAQIDPSAQPLYDRLETLSVEAADLSQEFSRLSQEGDIDEETAQTLQARMATWLELRRKYGNTPEDVLKKRDEWAQKIARQGDLEGFLEKMQAEANRLKTSLEQRAAACTQARKKAAKALALEAQKRLASLGFKKAGLSIEVIPLEDIGPCGNSRAEILFSPNPGTAPMPLRKIASGGETARVMLALKTALADIDGTPLLVFDEVDANVGGEIGAEVGRQLEGLSARHQVLCVTHLPQVAARGKSHLLVEKASDGNTTKVSIKSIHGDRRARESELARMLGDRSSKSALAHAKELLGAAPKAR